MGAQRWTLFARLRLSALPIDSVGNDHLESVVSESADDLVSDLEYAACAVKDAELATTEEERFECLEEAWTLTVKSMNAIAILRNQNSP